MAYSGPEVKLTGLKAAADLSAKQFYFVKLTADNTVNVCSALTDVPIGVLQNTPTANQAAEVTVLGQTKISGDADLDVGMLIGPSADSQADARTIGTDTTHYVVGQVIVGNTAAAGIVTAVINCCNPHRAA